MCRVFESRLEPSLMPVTEPHANLRVPARNYDVQRVAQFSLKMAHLSFSMILLGPRSCGVRPQIWLLLKCIPLREGPNI